MDLSNLTQEQRDATLRLYQLSTEAIFSASHRASPAGRIVALRGGAGTGKSEVLIQLEKLLITQKRARDEQAARTHSQAMQTSGLHDACEASVSKPKREKSDATIMRAARRERDEREIAGLENFEVFFEEE